MSRKSLFISLLTVLAIGIVVIGCAQKQSGGQPSASPKASPDQSAVVTHEGHDHSESAHTQNEAALAKLSPADRALAEKQKTCPVSGEPLGSMGNPYKVTVEGQDVLLCCSGCEAKIKENPQEYLAKINQ